jgi:uncharacterized protein YjiK
MPSKKLLASLLLGVSLIGLALWYSGYLSLVYYWTSLRLSPPAISGLGLQQYQVSIEARSIQGINKNASGLTFHPGRNSLFAVVNKPAQVIELSTEGKVLRQIPLMGAADIEGISHQQGNHFFIIEERKQRMTRIEIDDETRSLDIKGKPQISLAINAGNNIGLEGVSWDSNNERLLFVKEKRPLGIFELYGLTDLFQSNRLNLLFREWRPEAPGHILLNDLSSLTYHEPSGHLFLLSDESKLLLEYDANGQALNMLVLRAGWHSLKASIPQAEGVAIGNNREIFILSEPNLFYRFSPAANSGAE